MVSVCRMSVYLCYLARSHAIASLIDFLWFSFINFGTVAGQWCKIRDYPAIFGMVGNCVHAACCVTFIQEIGFRIPCKFSVSTKYRKFYFSSSVVSS